MHRSPGRASVVVTAVLVAALAGCGGGDEPGEDTGARPGPTTVASGEVTVDIESFAFAPDSLTVTKGTRVTWLNKDSAPHNAVARPAFGTPDLKKGASASYVASTPGTYEYICSIHPYMKATLTVR